jgi:bacteriorhodopsin
VEEDGRPNIGDLSLHLRLPANRSSDRLGRVDASKPDARPENGWLGLMICGVLLGAFLLLELMGPSKRVGILRLAYVVLAILSPFTGIAFFVLLLKKVKS